MDKGRFDRWLIAKNSEFHRNWHTQRRNFKSNRLAVPPNLIIGAVLVGEI